MGLAQSREPCRSGSGSQRGSVREEGLQEAPHNWLKEGGPERAGRQGNRVASPSTKRTEFCCSELREERCSGGSREATPQALGVNYIVT